MNQWIAIGRLTNDPEVRYGGAKNTCIARYSIAVQRHTKDASGNYPTDFFNMIAFGKNAEFAEKYLHKGMKIAVQGEWQNNNYKNKDGQMVYGMQVYVQSQEFCESKNAENAQNNGGFAQQSGGFTQTQAQTGGFTNAQPQPQPSPAPSQPAFEGGFMNISDDMSDELPFS